MKSQHHTKSDLRLRAKFFRQLGPNAEIFKEVLDLSDDICLNLKDSDGRIMALNRRNCEVCNIAREEDALGLTSDDLFPTEFASVYKALDAEVLKSRKPVRNRVTYFPADRSRRAMVSNLYPLRDREGRVIGSLHAYRLDAKSAADTRRYRQLRDAVEHLRAHYTEQTPIAELARLSQLSETAFKRSFKAIFGTTPGRYLLVLRLNAARELLEKTDRTLADIAIETGFFDQSHFSRLFTRERGLTPGAYRRRHRSR